MPDSQKNNGRGGISEFDMGTFLAKLDTKLDSLNNHVSEVIQDFKDVHKDHEQRIRVLETNSATKADNKKTHERIDKLQTTIWKIIVYLAAGGTVTGGGLAAYNYLSGGGVGM